MIRPCMTQDEYALWEAANLTVGISASSPCIDCPLAFAESMRLVDRCNGEPGSSLRSSVTDLRRTQWREAGRRRRERLRAAA